MTGRSDPVLPPLYSATRSSLPRAALRQKAGNLPEGTLLWSDANGRLALALLLDSETSFKESAPVALAAVIAMGDAIGALAPPVVAVTNAWPDRIEVNGALIGGIALDALPGGRLLLEAEPGVVAGILPLAKCLDDRAEMAVGAGANDVEPRT